MLNENLSFLNRVSCCKLFEIREKEIKCSCDHVGGDSYGASKVDRRYFVLQARPCSLQQQKARTAKEGGLGTSTTVSKW